MPQSKKKLFLNKQTEIREYPFQSPISMNVTIAAPLAPLVRCKFLFCFWLSITEWSHDNPLYHTIYYIIKIKFKNYNYLCQVFTLFFRYTTSHLVIVVVVFSMKLVLYNSCHDWLIWYHILYNKSYVQHVVVNYNKNLSRKTKIWRTTKSCFASPRKDV